MVVQVNDVGMVASELRQLNWVVYPDYHKDGSEKFWMVRTAYFHDVDYIDLTDGNYQARVSFDNIKPIPLTEEILLKCGFDKSLIYDNTYSLVITALNGNHDLFIDIRANVAIIGTIEIANFKSLHQLQNFFHSITGQELNVKL